jgi:arginase
MHNKNIRGIAESTKKLSDVVASAITSNYTPVVLGGDHSLAIGSINGTVAGLKAKYGPTASVGVIWIDAHADINTPLTSPSGNLHGQPVSFLLHELNDYIPELQGFESIPSCMPARNLVYIGLRDLDEMETKALHKYNIKAFTMCDMVRLGIKEVIRETLEYLTINGELLPLHVSVDIDCLDPWYAPSTGTPVLGGLTLPDLMYIGNSVHKTGKLVTLDLVEVNPMLKSFDTDVTKTVFSAMRTILSFFGYTTLGTHHVKSELPKPASNRSLNKLAQTE